MTVKQQLFIPIIVNLLFIPIYWFIFFLRYTSFVSKYDYLLIIGTMLIAQTIAFFLLKWKVMVKSIKFKNILLVLILTQIISVIFLTVYPIMEMLNFFGHHDTPDTVSFSAGLEEIVGKLIVFAFLMPIAISIIAFTFLKLGRKTD